MQQNTSQTETPRGTTIWLTGLSGAGKSTIAEAFKLHVETTFDKRVVVLDGDVIRRGLNKYDIFLIF